VETPGLGRGYAGGILSAMLKHLQAVIKQLIDRRRSDYSYDSAHRLSTYL